MSGTFSKLSYFPTMIFKYEIDDAEALNQKLLENIYAEQEADQAGISRSNIKELGGWHSHNNLHKSDKYSEIVSNVEHAGSEVSDMLGYDKKFKLKIGTMWSIINPPGSSNKSHVHPGCLWSGVYYIQTPENAGHIEFNDPRTMYTMNQGRFMPDTKRKKDCWTKVRMKPTAGTMFMFPAWLYHAVDPNVTKTKGKEGQRIIISFNMNQQKV